ncbi:MULTISPECIES: hypothetical protein [unclassified Pseudomonas]|uniref:hypothetical protein n=1 Tax=unclassified Pseudomonas TaxID=196821 RepID=UPI002AC9C85D|nr:MULTISPECIES: hypothetical protein [unclassified Pseudomonas]MEB0048786.1 hypothetical protein [Pseudomonas sp. Dout3]MEB0099609.1 hypothetical protein [Pseudomonas sp. DC1.2]WPX56615.1 hypothetical protein RHM68_13105 [Pseudomonas sp. DC1.2]
MNMYGSTYLTVKRGINLVIKFLHRSGCKALNGANPEKNVSNCPFFPQPVPFSNAKRRCRYRRLATTNFFNLINALEETLAKKGCLLSKKWFYGLILSN